MATATIGMSPKEVLAKNNPQLLGSKLGSAKRECLVAAMLGILSKEDKWRPVGAKELPDALESQQLPVYKLFPQQMWNEFWAMVGEGLLTKGHNDQGDYIEMTPKIIQLLTA